MKDPLCCYLNRKMLRCVVGTPNFFHAEAKRRIDVLLALPGLDKSKGENHEKYADVKRLAQRTERVIGNHTAHVS